MEQFRVWKRKDSEFAVRQVSRASNLHTFALKAILQCIINKNSLKKNFNSRQKLESKYIYLIERDKNWHEDKYLLFNVIKLNNYIKSKNQRKNKQYNKFGNFPVSAKCL